MQKCNKELSYTYKNYYNLKKHLLNDHQIKVATNTVYAKIDQLKCPFCGKEIVSNGLRQHYKRLILFSNFVMFSSNCFFF